MIGVLSVLENRVQELSEILKEVKEDIQTPAIQKEYFERVDSLSH